MSGRASVVGIKKPVVPILASTLVILASALAGVGAALLVPRLGGLALPLALFLPLASCVVLLCWFKFDLMLFAAFASSSVVFIEPAPVDLLLLLLLLVGLVKGHLSLRRLQGAPLIHLAAWMLVLTNLFALIRPYPAPASTIYAGVSLYLLASIYLIKMYVTSSHHGHVILAGYWVSAWVAVVGVIPAYLGLGGEQFLLIGSRARGFFKDPNVFGPFLVPLFVLLLDELVDPTVRRVPAFVKGLTLVLTMIGVFLSFSRAAWINLAIAVSGYVGLCLLKRRHVGRLLSVLSVGVALALLLTVALFATRPDLMDLLNWRLNLVQQYDTFRFARHEEGIVAAFTHPTGLGPGTFGGAHQLYIRTLAEQGLLGLLALTTLLLATTAKSFQAALRSNKVYGLSTLALLAGLAGTLANGFVIDTIHWRHFYLLLGLSWAVSDPVAGSDGQERHDE